MAATRQRRLNVLIYVQHLLGSGHLVRMRRVAEALVQRGHAVCLVSGGTAVAGATGGYRTRQLPILKTAAGDFRSLLTADGRVADAAWLAERRRQLLALVERQRPQVLVVESYPFGRKQLAQEIQAMLCLAHAQRPRPAVVCSIRDVLQRRSERREQQTQQLVQRYFDRVLVHGDAQWLPLSASYRLADGIADKVCYTGYVTQSDCGQSEPGAADGRDEVIISAGGGAVGERLLRCVLRAGQAVGTGGRTWRVLVGGGVDEAAFNRYRQGAGTGLIVQRNRRDFPLLLRRCALSVSQAGYNTCTDILTAGCRAILVPYARDGETEQRQRAAVLAAKAGCLVLPESRLSTRRLVDTLARALDSKHLRPCIPAMDGADRSALLIEQAARMDFTPPPGPV